MEEVVRAEEEIRKRVWSLLEREGVARFPGAWGRIPNFTGADGAVTAALGDLAPCRSPSRSGRGRLVLGGPSSGGR